MLRYLVFVGLLLSLTGAYAEQVYRCGNQYSGEPCGKGTVVDVSPPVRNLDSAGAGQVFLCVSNSGGRFWSSSHCRERGAFVERIESVPAGLPWNQQVQLADQQTRQGYAVQQRAMDQRGAATAGVTSAGDPARCAHWNQQLEYYDRLARQPRAVRRNRGSPRDEKRWA